MSISNTKQIKQTNPRINVPVINNLEIKWLPRTNFEGYITYNDREPNEKTSFQSPELEAIKKKPVQESANETFGKDWRIITSGSESKESIISTLSNSSTDLNYVTNFIVDFLQGNLSEININSTDIKNLLKSRSKETFNLNLSRENNFWASKQVVTYKNTSLENAFPNLYKVLVLENKDTFKITDIAEKASGGIPNAHKLLGSPRSELRNLSRNDLNISNQNQLFNQELIEGSQQIATKYDQLGLNKANLEQKNDLEEVAETILERILLEQNIYKDEANNIYPIIFTSDRDNSTNFGELPKDYKTRAIRNANHGRKTRWQDLDTKFQKSYANALESDKHMNTIHEQLLKQGIPPTMVTGALFEEIYERIKARTYAPPIIVSATGTEEYLRVNPDNPSHPTYKQNPEYKEAINNYLKKNQINYSKSNTVNAVNQLIQSWRNSSAETRVSFQPGMDIIQGDKVHEFITSLHVDDTQEKTDEIKEKLENILGDDYKLSSGIDAEGDAEISLKGGKTKHFINIVPRDFDGKKFYFDFIGERTKKVLNKFIDPTKDQTIIPVTIGYADSKNDQESLINSKVPGLGVVVANGVKLNSPDSEFMKHLSPLETKTRQALSTHLKTYGILDQSKCDEILNRLYQVKNNQQRFVYAPIPESPNDTSKDLNKVANIAHSLLNALLKTNQFNKHVEMRPENFPIPVLDSELILKLENQLKEKFGNDINILYGQKNQSFGISGYKDENKYEILDLIHEQIPHITSTSLHENGMFFFTGNQRSITEPKFDELIANLPYQLNDLITSYKQ